MPAAWMAMGLSRGFSKATRLFDSYFIICTRPRAPTSCSERPIRSCFTRAVRGRQIMRGLNASSKISDKRFSSVIAYGRDSPLRSHLNHRSLQATKTHSPWPKDNNSPCHEPTV